MNDEELRALVREAVARYAGTPAADAVHRPSPVAMLRLHPSHGTFTLPAGSDMDGPCLIEPAVTCNHCLYCKSYGH